MDDNGKIEYCDIEQIPYDILEKNYGRWVVWDQDDKRLLGTGDTLEEAYAQADLVDKQHMRRIHYVNWDTFVTTPEKD